MSADVAGGCWVLGVGFVEGGSIAEGIPADIETCSNCDGGSVRAEGGGSAQRESDAIELSAAVDGAGGSAGLPFGTIGNCVRQSGHAASWPTNSSGAVSSRLHWGH